MLSHNWYLYETYTAWRTTPNEQFYIQKHSKFDMMLGFIVDAVLDSNTWENFTHINKIPVNEI